MIAIKSCGNSSHHSHAMRESGEYIILKKHITIKSGNESKIQVFHVVNCECGEKLARLEMERKTVEKSYHKKNVPPQKRYVMCSEKTSDGGRISHGWKFFYSAAPEKFFFVVHFYMVFDHCHMISMGTVVVDGDDDWRDFWGMCGMFIYSLLVDIQQRNQQEFRKKLFRFCWSIPFHFLFPHATTRHRTTAIKRRKRIGKNSHNFFCTF